MTPDRPASPRDGGRSPTPASAPVVERRSRQLDRRVSARERRLWYLVAVAFLADTVLTAYGIHLGYAETNPLMRHVLASQGIAGIVALKAGGVVVAVTCRSLVERTHRPLVPAALALPWLTAALVNAVVISG